MGGGGRQGEEENNKCGELVTILYTNAQSIIKKMEELRAVVVMKKPDIVALTETWTDADIDNNFLHISDYEILERGQNGHEQRERWHPSVC